MHVVRSGRQGFLSSSRDEQLELESDGEVESSFLWTTASTAIAITVAVAGWEVAAGLEGVSGLRFTSSVLSSSISST